VNLHAVSPFFTWLAATPVSQTIQSVTWIIPAVQTVHILCVAAVMVSVLLVNLRLLGVAPRDMTIDATLRRFLPAVWWPLPILLATGATLIVAEPERALENPVFVLKMSLLLAGTLLTFGCGWVVRHRPGFWDRDVRRRGLAQLLATASLLIWAAIVFAGRWIAYVQVT